MAYEENVTYIGSLTADGDLSTHQFKLVRLETNGNVGLADGDTVANERFIIGVLGNKPKTGERCQIAALRPGSIVKLVAGNVIAKGAIVYPVALVNDGRVDDIAAVADALEVGISLEAAGAAGEIIAVLVTNNTVGA